MRVAILGNGRPSFVKIMSEGLQRMLTSIGVESEIFYDGLELLHAVPQPFREFVRHPDSNPVRRTARYIFKELPRFEPFIRRLRQFDVVIVVTSLPDAFMTMLFDDDAVRRHLHGIPILLYDVFYLGTRGPWARWLRDGNVDRGIAGRGHWGLDRYDWYLAGSLVSDFPLPPGPQPCSRIGVHFDDGTLYPEPKEDFIALIDFEQPFHLRERAIQIMACEETDTPYLVLSGRYSIENIRRIYRQSSIFFVAYRESFGLPICEVQACGSYVFTPYNDWCPSHWLKEDLSQPGPGVLPENFVVYENDKNRLKEAIRRIKASYRANAVVERFLTIHPHYFHGDVVELQRVLGMIADGTITDQTHRQHGNIVISEHGRTTPDDFDRRDGRRASRRSLTAPRGNPHAA
jgi:hypothetical protein